MILFHKLGTSGRTFRRPDGLNMSEMYINTVFAGRNQHLGETHCCAEAARHQDGRRRVRKRHF